VADLFRHGVSATGDQVASWRGQIFLGDVRFRAQRPIVLLITIYIFAPYFTSTLVADPVKGQAIWGDIQGYSGLVIALLAPFIGAIADAAGDANRGSRCFRS